MPIKLEVVLKTIGEAMITTAIMSANQQQNDCYGSMKVRATISAIGDAESSGNVEDFTGKPKRPLSAYNLFFRDQRELLLEELPSRQGRKPKRSHGKINFKDLANTIAAKWKEITPAEKERYEKIASVGREKYMRLAKAWKKKQKQFKKQQQKNEKANLKAISRKPPPKEEERQQRASQLDSSCADVAAPSDVMINKRFVTPRASQWNSQYSLPVPVSRPHDFVTEVNTLHKVAQQHPELGMDHDILAPRTAPTSLPVAAFEEEDLTDLPLSFSFSEHQHQRQQPMTVASSGASNSVRTFSFREQTQRSMSLPRMPTTDTELAYLNSFGAPRMLQSQSLPFPPAMNMSSVPQTRVNATWNNTTRMHQHQSPGLSFHTPTRTNSLPCRLPTNSSSPGSLNMVPAPDAFRRVFYTGNPEPVQEEQHRRLHDFETEPLPFQFTNEGLSHHHGNYRRHRSLESTDNIHLTDNMDLFTETFDDANDL